MKQHIRKNNKNNCRHSVMNTIKIGKSKVGPDEPVFIIAEAGVNHNGNLDIAKKHVSEAKNAGADAIKFQTYKAGSLVTKDAPRYWHVGNDEGKSQYEVFSAIDKFPNNYFQKTLNHAGKLGIELFSTPFDLSAVDDLEYLKVPAYKIASADITYHKLLKKVAKTYKPIILSTGASTIGEIEEAIQVIKHAGNDQIILLHCILSYPTHPKDANLLMIDFLQHIFPEIPIGFSDHTFNPLTPALSVMRGAKVVEKHFTIDNSMPDSPDHQLGVNPEQLRHLVESVRLAEQSLGQHQRVLVKSEVEALKLARRSIVSTVDIPKGTLITEEMLTCKRPGTGISPQMEGLIVRRIAKQDIPADTVLTWKMLH